MRTSVRKGSGDEIEQGPRYPDVMVKLTGHDGNAGAIMSTVTTILRRKGVSKVVLDEFRREAMSGNYDELIQTVMEWVDVE